MTSQPHIILGISKQSTIPQIKAQYHKLAKKCHPDKVGDTEYANKQFSKISEAYETMISPKYQSTKHLAYQQGVFYPKNNKPRYDPRFPPPTKTGPRVLCNGTVLMNGLHPSNMTYDFIQNLRKNIH
jgi:curved DNA-binding protein CbpA